MCGCLSCAPNWGPGLKPRHALRLGIEPATLWFTACAQSTGPQQPGQSLSPLDIAFFRLLSNSSFFLWQTSIILSIPLIRVYLSFYFTALLISLCTFSLNKLICFLHNVITDLYSQLRFPSGFQTHVFKCTLNIQFYLEGP